eukprot:XP_014018800.1 PREDICTED: von Willebrand factor A domain-containing protein 5A-like isoform X4 [Salmo salar]
MQSLRFALQPAVVDISVKWNVPKGVSVTPLSPPIRVVFQGQRAILYAQLTGESSGDTEGSVTVKYSLAKQPVENQLSFILKPAEDTGMTVHRLGARTLIQSLEVEEREQDGEKEGVKEKVIELSVQSGVSSAFTAFIAVHKGDGEALQGQLLRRQVPTPNFDSPAPTSKPVRDLLLQLISLQKASGSWVLEAALSEVLAKTEEEVSKPKPAQVDQEVWATVLALVWLYGFKMEAQEDWQFVAMKAVSWIQAQKATSVSECVQAGNNLLGCQVQKDTLGL